MPPDDLTPQTQLRREAGEDGSPSPRPEAERFERAGFAEGGAGPGASLHPRGGSEEAVPADLAPDDVVPGEALQAGPSVDYVTRVQARLTEAYKPRHEED